MNKDTREDGYYWVSKMNELYSDGKIETWFIAYWDSLTGFWCIAGDENIYRDISFFEINPSRLIHPTS